jgi:hypothetical protein
MKMEFNSGLVELAYLLYQVHTAFYGMSTDDYANASSEVNRLACEAGTNINEVAKVLAGAG